MKSGAPVCAGQILFLKLCKGFISLNSFCDAYYHNEFMSAIKVQLLHLSLVHEPTCSFLAFFVYHHMVVNKDW